MIDLFKDILKSTKPIDVIGGKDIRIIIQDDEDNLAWESKIKAILEILNHIPVEFIQETYDEPFVTERISLVLLDSIGSFLKEHSSDSQYEELNTSFEAIMYFIVKMVKERKGIEH